MWLFGPPNVEKMKAKRDVKGLIKALRYQKDDDVRWEAAAALGEIGDARAVEPLSATPQDSDRDVRWEAARALEQIGDARAIEPLRAALRDSDRHVREAAAEALGKIRDARAVEPLISTLKDSDSDVRYAAAGALVQIGTPAVAPLIAALKHSDSNVRQATAGALDKISWRPGQDEVGATYWVTKREWDKCIEIGTPAVEPLDVLLSTGSKDDQMALVKAVKNRRSLVEIILSTADYKRIGYDVRGLAILRISAKCELCHRPLKALSAAGVTMSAWEMGELAGFCPSCQTVVCLGCGGVALKAMLATGRTSLAGTCPKCKTTLAP